MADINMIRPNQVQNIINKFCYTIGIIPTSYKLSLTYEEQILTIGRYLEEVVYPAINNNAEALKELQDLFIELKDFVENYFDNLDVQQEINNKLNVMIEDGTFDNIINQELFNNLNQQISNLQTQQGQLSNNLNNVSSNLNNNINKTNLNETKINNLESSKADNSDLLDVINNTNKALYNQFEILGNLQGGTPIVVSSTSAMVDTSKIYVLTTDGKWYYYNGNSFVAGGTYQASQFAENSIDSNAIKRLDYSKVECVPLIEDLNTTTWNGARVTYHSKNNIQINTENRTQTDSGVFIFNLNDIDKTKDLVLFANCSGIKFNVYLYNGTNSFIKTLYGGRNKPLNNNIYLKIKSTDISSLTDPKILIATSELGDIYMTNVTLTYYNNFDYKLKNLINKINEISPNYDNITDKTLETNIIDWTNQSFGNEASIMAQSPNTFNFCHNTTSGQSRGYTSPQLNKTDKKLIIEADIENVSQAKLTFSFYIAKNNQSFISVANQDLVDENGHFKIIIDMPYYAVYEGYSNYYVWLMTSVPGYINFSNFKFYYSDITETSIYADNFNDLIKNIDNKLTTSTLIKNEITFIQAPNKKYFVQANNSGNIQLINVIPNKTLFIGNSLLLGNQHGDYAFGMCATNIDNDYYKHLTSYILEKNENAIFEKLSGSSFEGATSQTDVTQFLNNTLLPKLTDDLDLVVVQLGDNVNTQDKLTMFNTSCLELLQFIRVHAPNSRVVFVGEWYSSAQKQTIIANACKNSGCQFVDISLLNTLENQASIGTIIYYPDGYTSTVETSGVASHPSNIGFRKIADKIINEIF